MAAKKAMKVKIKGKKDDDSKLFAFLGVFLTITGFVIVYATKKENKYAMFYAKQGFVLFFAWIAVAIAQLIFMWIPVIGMIINALLWLGILILWVIGIIYSLSDEEKEIPVIGHFAKMIKL